MTHSVSIEDEVFGVLDRQGPLDVDRICLQIHHEPEEVIHALDMLRQERAVQSGVDPDNETHVVWKSRR